MCRDALRALEEPLPQGMLGNRNAGKVRGMPGREGAVRSGKGGGRVGKLPW